MNRIIEYIGRICLLFLLLILTYGMSEKQILSLILISVVYIFWHLLSKDLREE